jgi:hypothetical protein
MRRSAGLPLTSSPAQCPWRARRRQRASSTRCPDGTSCSPCPPTAARACACAACARLPARVSYCSRPISSTSVAMRVQRASQRCSANCSDHADHSGQQQALMTQPTPHGPAMAGRELPNAGMLKQPWCALQFPATLQSTGQSQHAPHGYGLDHAVAAAHAAEKAGNRAARCRHCRLGSQTPKRGVESCQGLLHS